MKRLEGPAGTRGNPARRGAHPMFQYLHIPNRRERVAVGAADAVLRAGALRRWRRRRPADPPHRVLLLRLERIGDLLMTLDAIEDVRRALPHARIDLVVGSWNLQLAAAIPAVSAVEAADAPWLAREAGGASFAALLSRAATWRRRRYDLAINFEPDIRSNLLLGLSGAARTCGYFTGGGGALLDVAIAGDARAHTADNAVRLVHAALPVPVPPRTDPARLAVPDDAARRARRLLERQGGAPLVGIHASAGRLVKQWEPSKFAELARRLTQAPGATIVLTGTAADRGLVDAVRAALPVPSTIDLAGQVDLLTLAAVLQQLDVFVTADTGPMHLAAAVGTPVAAIFGPSDPVRYAPREAQHRTIRIDLPCSPCNRIRQPPARCAGHTPDCLAGLDVDRVYAAVLSQLERRAASRASTGAARP